MGQWKVPVTARIRPGLRAEMIAFAERENRSLGNLGAMLLESSFEELKVAGSTNALFGSARSALTA